MQGEWFQVPGLDQTITDEKSVLRHRKWTLWVKRTRTDVVLLIKYMQRQCTHMHTRTHMTHFTQVNSRSLTDSALFALKLPALPFIWSTFITISEHLPHFISIIVLLFFKFYHILSFTNYLEICISTPRRYWLQVLLSSSLLSKLSDHRHAFSLCKVKQTRLSTSPSCSPQASSNIHIVLQRWVHIYVALTGLCF